MQEEDMDEDDSDSDNGGFLDESEIIGYHARKRFDILSGNPFLIIVIFQFLLLFTYFGYIGKPRRRGWRLFVLGEKEEANLDPPKETIWFVSLHLHYLFLFECNGALVFLLF